MDERRHRERRMTSKEVLHDARHMKRRKANSADAAVHSELSKSDLRIIFLVGIHLAKVDGEFHWEEARILQLINDILELTAEERQELLQGGFNLKEGLEALATQKARELLLMTLCAIAQSDQNIHGAEWEFIDKIKSSLGIRFEIKPPGMWHEYEEEVTEILRTELA
jgi:tellurite resistance protein